MISATDLIPFANHLWQSSLFVLAVWACTLALQKNRAAVRYRLWLTASIKFLIPFSLLVSLGARIPTRTSSGAAPPRIAAIVQTVGEPFAPSYSKPVSFVSAQSARSSQLQSRPSRFLTVVVSLWFLGFVVSLLWWFFRWQQIRCAVQEGTPLRLVPDFPALLIKGSKRMEPGVFGIFRPILLLPEGITECLSTDELQAVIDHERCHVRRHDNMATSIHLFVEAVFWFHPLVWWIKVRLLDEQERACDDEVLASGANSRVYAEAILKICKLYLNAPVAVVAGISGSNLKQRIEVIMQRRIGVPLGFSRRALLTLAIGTVLVGPIAIGAVQTRVDRIEPHQMSVASLQVGNVRDATFSSTQTETSRDFGRTSTGNSVELGAGSVVQAPTGNLIRGFWEIENPVPAETEMKPLLRTIQLTFDGSTGKSFSLDSSPFHGLTSAQITSANRTTVQFEFETEAGKFVCEGAFQMGRGKGSYVFYADDGFLREMATLGFPEIQEQQLVSIALHGAGPRFMSELRSAGIIGTTFDQLMGMRALGVTGEYIRRIQQAGYSPNPDELISMWVQGVSPEFASEIRRLYPAASITDLIGLQVSGVRGNR